MLKLKGIDGGSHKGWIMRINLMIREEPYQGLTFLEFFRNGEVPDKGTNKQVVHGCRQLVS